MTQRVSNAHKGLEVDRPIRSELVPPCHTHRSACLVLLTLVAIEETRGFSLPISQYRSDGIRLSDALNMNATSPIDASISTVLCNVSANALQTLQDSTLVNDRTVWNIIWSSLSTIFACTWVACHPNIPALDATWLQRKGGRFKMFVIALLVPEVIVLCAMRQFFAARYMGQELQNFFENQETKEESRGAIFRLIII